jgi:2-keto-4-pentenoate hydratase/2-oxohepta-3-ene-1,7-dioic acid hydratase in catechol pathway
LKPDILRLATAVVDNKNRICIKVGDQLADLNLAYEALLQDQGDPNAHQIASIRIPQTMIGLIEGGEPSLAAAKSALDYATSHPDLVGRGGEKIFHDMQGTKFMAALPRPNKLLHLGVNSEGIMKVFMDQTPKRPMMFHKANSSVIADGEKIVLMPRDEGQLMTTEVEVGIIIGKRGRMIPIEKAFEHIFGYVVVNDITAQDRTDLFDLGSKSMGEMILGSRLPTEQPPIPGGHNVTATIIEMKNYDTWLPMGRFIVTKDEIKDPDNLHYTGKVNGKIVQEGNSSKILVKTAQSIAAFSRIMTLEPGDVICAGTVGLTSGAVLRAGITLESTVEDVGSITNPCVAWEDEWKKYTTWDEILDGTPFLQKREP